MDCVEQSEEPEQLLDASKRAERQQIALKVGRKGGIGCRGEPLRVLRGLGWYFARSLLAGYRVSLTPSLEAPAVIRQPYRKQTAVYFVIVRQVFINLELTLNSLSKIDTRCSILFELDSSSHTHRICYI